MKRPILFAAIAMLSASLFAEEVKTDDAINQKPTFFELRNAAVSPKKLEATKSARFLFSVTGKDVKAFMLLRAKRYDQVRLDGFSNEEIFCSVRNGDKFWSYNKKDGINAMDQDEQADFSEYIEFLSIPFYKEPVFGEPVFKGEETNNKIKRSRFEVKTLNNSGSVYEFWIENKSRLLKKVEKTDALGNLSVIMLSQYQDFNGIKMAKSIFISSTEGSFKLKLIKADWNLDLDEKIFDKSSKVIDPELSQLIKSPTAEEAKKAVEKKKRDQKRIEQLEKKIRKLKLEIESNEKMLKTMEGVSKSDRQSVVSLSSITSSNSSSGYYWGWGSSRTSSQPANRDSITRRKTVNNATEEIKDTSREYRNLSKKILQQRIDLGDAEAELQKLLDGVEKDSQE